MKTNRKNKTLTEDEVFKILKQFTKDCVHGGDFDQGQSEKETLNILKTWWNKHKNKYFDGPAVIGCTCDACGRQYEEPNPAEQFGEFNTCPECKLRTDICWE
jgi:hypothetical protein